jgi:hypothetical protein
MTNLQALEAALGAGTISLAQISACEAVGFEFDTDSFDCLDEAAGLSVLAELGLTAAPIYSGRDIHDLNHEAARQRARFAGIKGA